MGAVENYNDASSDWLNAQERGQRSLGQNWFEAAREGAIAAFNRLVLAKNAANTVIAQFDAAQGKKEGV